MRRSCWWCWCERSCSGKAGRRRRQARRCSGWSGGGVLGRGIAEQAKERVEKVSGVFVRLVRALGEGGGLSLGRAMATARWRPCGGFGRRGEGRGHQRDGKGRWGSSGATRGLAGRRWRGEAALHGGRAALCTAAVGKTEERSWRKGKRTQTKILKFPGTKL